MSYLQEIESAMLNTFRANLLSISSEFASNRFGLALVDDRQTHFHVAEARIHGDTKTSTASSFQRQGTNKLLPQVFLIRDGIFNQEGSNFARAPEAIDFCDVEVEDNMVARYLGVPMSIDYKLKIYFNDFDLSDLLVENWLVSGGSEFSRFGFTPSLKGIGEQFVTLSYKEPEFEAPTRDDEVDAGLVFTYVFPYTADVLIWIQQPSHPVIVTQDIQYHYDC